MNSCFVVGEVNMRLLFVDSISNVFGLSLISILKLILCGFDMVLGFLLLFLFIVIFVLVCFLLVML